MGLRDTQDYKEMNPLLAAGIAAGIFPSDDYERYLAACQYVHDNHIEHQFEGSFGRGIENMIEDGLIDP